MTIERRLHTTPDAEGPYNVFVSMPFGKEEDGSNKFWNRFYQHAVLGMRHLFEKRGYQVNFLRAKEEPSALTVHENVQKLIEQSHICLGVITGLNPNVLYEVGYADRGRVPIILIVAEAGISPQYMPVLLAYKLKEPYDGKVFDKPDPDPVLVREFQERLLKLFDIAVVLVKGGTKPVPQFEVFTSREEANLAKMIANAKHTIDLITTNLSYFANTEMFTVDVEDVKQFAFDIAIRNRVRVRILTLDPDSQIAAYRAIQLQRAHDVAGYREELRNAARFFYHRYGSFMDILVYDDLPLQSTLNVDGHVISSFVSRGHQARFNIHVAFDPDFSGTRTTFEEHFAEVRASQAQTAHISRFKWAQVDPDGEGHPSIRDVAK